MIPSNWLQWTPSTVSQKTHFNQNVLPEINNGDSSWNIKSKFLIGKTYKDALEAVKSSCEYLLVAVSSDIHQQPSSKFVSHVLSMNVVKRDDVKVWFVSAQTVEGLNIVSSYGVKELPFLAILSPSPKTAQTSIMVMENVFQFSGSSLSDHTKRDKVDASALAAMEQHEPKLLALRLERSRFDADRQLREEQDMAYKTSLEQDRKKTEAAEAKLAEDRLRESLYLHWASRLTKRVSVLRESSSSGARVSLRFPDGHRLNITVPGDQPVTTLYDIAYSHLHPDLASTTADGFRTLGNTGGDVGLLLDNYDPPYEFSLVSTQTRNILSPTSTLVKDEKCIWPSGVFMVDLE